MPRGAPFTVLCQATAHLRQRVTVDLHLHTTASDGEATPGQLVLAALYHRLEVIAVTDHDTVASVFALQDAASQLASGRLRIVSGVEISTRDKQQELHLLGLNVDPEEPSLCALLKEIQAGRAARFEDYVRQIPQLARACELGLPEVIARSTSSIGRRHVAKLLVQAGITSTIPEAFQRYIVPTTPRVIPKLMPSIEEAIIRIHAAGGLAVLAHPPKTLTQSDFSRLRALGLDAIEAIFPAASLEQTQELHRLATEFDWGITGGSDSHDPVTRPPGSFGISRADFQRLEERLDRTPAAVDRMRRTNRPSSESQACSS
jgi:predicted metal-dependent phosphoesterase TrpH